LAFSTVELEDLNYFKGVVGQENLLTSILGGDDDLNAYNVDFTKKFKGNTKVVLTPTSTE
jgi:hypothetical protein